MAKRTGVDEFKLIGLLWRDSPVSPRSGISTQSVTTLAVDLADREGLDAVTIRRLAEEAGVTAMALYPHIGGRAELVELMLDHVAGVTYETVTIPEGADWRECVTAIAEANWASCQAHPWITDLATGRPVRRSEEHTSELQSRGHLVFRLLLEKKKTQELMQNQDT